MRTHRIGWSFIVALVAIGLLTSVAVSQQDKPTTAPAGGGSGASSTPTPEQMMAAMVKYGTPGPEHEKLKPFAGTFNADVTMQMPGMPAQNSKGKMVNEMILGGRYLRGEFSGDMMGQPFTGTSVTGFDLMSRKYVNTWIDSMSTFIMYAEGAADDSGKSITFKCTYDCPITQSKRTMRQVVTLIDNDTHTMEMYDAGPDGKETKNMSIKYTRAK